jgi:hypothetical protein
MGVLSRAGGFAGTGVGVMRKASEEWHADWASWQGDKGNHWLVVTINKSPEEVGADGKLPEPLEKLRDRIDVKIRPAAGDKGTELAARLREPVPSGMEGLAARLSGNDPRQEVRLALRQAKSLIETGEVLQPDKPGTTHPGPAGKLLQTLVQRSRGEGRL